MTALEKEILSILERAQRCGIERQAANREGCRLLLLLFLPVPPSLPPLRRRCGVLENLWAWPAFFIKFRPAGVYKICNSKTAIARMDFSYWKKPILAHQMRIWFKHGLKVFFFLMESMFSTGSQMYFFALNSSASPKYTQENPIWSVKIWRKNGMISSKRLYYIYGAKIHEKERISFYDCKVEKNTVYKVVDKI